MSAGQTRHTGQPQPVTPTRETTGTKGHLLGSQHRHHDHPVFYNSPNVSLAPPSEAADEKPKPDSPPLPPLPIPLASSLTCYSSHCLGHLYFNRLDESSTSPTCSNPQDSIRNQTVRQSSDAPAEPEWTRTDPWTMTWSICICVHILWHLDLLRRSLRIFLYSHADV